MNDTAAELRFAMAHQTAKLFLDSLLRGDQETAMGLLVLADRETVKLDKVVDPQASYELGQPQADGVNVVVEARLRSCPPGETQVQEQSLPMVLRFEEGMWRVDVGASMSRMLGFDLEQGMTELAEGMGKAMSDMVGGLAEGLSEGLKAVGMGEGPADEQESSEEPPDSQER